MHNGEPIALFLRGTSDHSNVPQLAARCGFRSLVAPWQCCRPRPGGVYVRDASEVHPEGRRSPLLGAISLKPSLIAVLTPLRVARDHGRELVTSSGAIWGHCDVSTNGVMRHGNGHRSAEVCAPTQVVHGVVESHPDPPLLRLAFPAAGADVSGWKDSINLDHNPRPELDPVTRQALEQFLGELHAPANRSGHHRASYRTIAPFALLLYSESENLPLDPICALADGDEQLGTFSPAMVQWLSHVRSRLVAPAPLTLPHCQVIANAPNDDFAITPELFPSLFGTSQYIETELIPDAFFAYLDPDLIPLDLLKGESAAAALRRILCRRRCFGAAETQTGPRERRLVETGVGRTCIVGSVRSQSREHFHDFTALGVGLTQFSEGGFMEMGRKIDGKAAMIRAWHRKACAERLEQEHCRTGKVVAIIEVPGDRMEMPDGSLTPVCIVVRGFRCTLRIKQLDPVVCSLHSLQHTPLVSAYLTRRVQDLRFAHGFPDVKGLNEDEAIAHEIEMQGASQTSLRRLLATPISTDLTDDGPTLVRCVRLEVLDEYAPALLRLAKSRLAVELNSRAGAVSDEDYVSWFAGSLGTQLAVWRRLRFLHDYHHPGVTRWQPDSLFSLGENNVTLLAEFPDLDTALFVDDEPEYLASTLQLESRDIELLRESFHTFHRRDVLAAETVVRTLTMVMFRGDNEAVENSAQIFRKSYEDA